MTNPIVDPMVGRTVAHYEIVARRGGGGMGVVYEARDTKLARTVALKFLPQQWSHDDAAKQRFVREAQAASATHHPNICTVHDIDTADDGQLFIVMAYYEGVTLKQRLEAEGPLPVHEALDIATQVADGLAKAHAQGIVHRDIKPGNLILTEDGVRIVDFGLATFADALQLTIPGSTLGTAAYMSPEQARGEEADSRSDVWAVGVMLYEMLVGHVPFRGVYAEAIAYAIRNDAPAPVREQRPEVSEEVEQLVFRALHKDPAVRYQNGRELARALRQARGQTVPLDLRTQMIDVPAPAAVRASPPRRSRARLWAAVAAAVVLPLALGAWWLFRPVPRATVVVAPVINLTGEPELDPYRLALTESLIARLAESRDVRPVPYARMLPALRRFLAAAGGGSGREAIQALAASTGSNMIIVPVLSYENNMWRASVEFQNASTGTRVGSFDTDALPSSLPKDTAYQLISSLAAGIEDHFKSSRSRMRDLIASPIQATTGSSSGFASLDAARTFEEGVRAFEALEYARARDAFAAAGTLDPGHVLPVAWQVRVASLLGKRQAAREGAARALKMIAGATPPVQALFAQAVAYEAQGEVRLAQERYGELIDRFPDEPQWLVEQAAFLDRQQQAQEAVVSYHAALNLDQKLVRPRVELCRLYNSTRMNNAPLAKKFGEEAREIYRALGDDVGEGQALLCLADILRIGTDEQRAEAREHADRALAIFQANEAPYNVARALQYAGLVRGFANLEAAVGFWERSLTAAEQVDSTELQAIVLNNLGVAHAALGGFTRAIEFYRRGIQVNEVRGDQRRAAFTQANAGALLIEYGPAPDEGFRDVQNALSVIRSIVDRNIEVFCLQVIAAYHRYHGQYAEAESEIRKALAIAADIGSQDLLASLSIDLGRLEIDKGAYAAAEATLTGVIATAPGQRVAEARLALGRLRVLLGDFEAARADLSQAATQITAQNSRGLLPLLYVSQGELAYESAQTSEAMAGFSHASALWGEDLPDAASVEARANLGLQQALSGRVRSGTALVESSLEQARRMQRTSLEAKCRVFLARIALQAGRAGEALAALADVPDGRVNKELGAQVHYWRALALAAGRDADPAREEHEIARRTVHDLLDAMPERYRARFSARPDIMAVLQ